MYITGGIGGTHLGEAFSFPYDLPNDTAYSETCAAIGLAFFARRMLEIEAVGEYGDVMEQALYNTVLAGMALDGKSFFYVNPLEVLPEACEKDERKRHVKSLRQKWFGCACCPPNIARIVSSLGAYVYTANENTLYTHLYVGSRIDCSLGGEQFKMLVESDFPWEGDVKVALYAAGRVQGTLAFRIPGWCRRAEVLAQADDVTLAECQVLAGELVRKAEAQADHGIKSSAQADHGKSLGNGQAPDNIQSSSSLNAGRTIAVRFEKGYVYLTGEWRDGDEIFLTFPMETHMISTNTKVRENVGKVAFTRGPICYCLEEADNGKDLHLLRADEDKLMTAEGVLDLSAIAVEKTNELGHDMCILKIPGRRLLATAGEELYVDYIPVRGSETTLTLVPYYAWNNRGEGEMQVWTAI